MEQYFMQNGLPHTFFQMHGSDYPCMALFVKSYNKQFRNQRTGSILRFLQFIKHANNRKQFFVILWEKVSLTKVDKFV